MKLRIIGHPRRRMNERGVSEADIENAIQNRHTSLHTRANSITYVGPGLDGRDLKVWVLPPGHTDDEATIVVKSVAWKDREDEP